MLDYQSSTEQGEIKVRKRITPNQRQMYQVILSSNGFEYNRIRSDYYSATYSKKINAIEINVTLGSRDRTVNVEHIDRTNHLTVKNYNSLDGLLTSTSEFKTLIEKL